MPRPLYLAYSRSIMGRTYEMLNCQRAAWIGRRHLFFTAAAPDNGGHINCSPKRLDTIRILSPRTVAYLDLTTQAEMSWFST